MTLEEAIIHAEEVVDRCEVTDGDRACAEEHRQLAEWLRELQERRKQPEHKWIPASERLPDKDGVYLVTINRFSWNGNRTTDIILMDFADEEFIEDEGITAWMHLPEPYREDDAERRTDGA